MEPKNVLPITKERAEILYVEQALMRMGVGDPSNFIISRSDLRLEKQLSADTDNYEFNIRQDSNSDRPTEAKLNLNDLFFITDIALGVTKQNPAATPPEYANNPIYTYEDEQVFSAANEAKSISTVWNGKLLFSTSVTTRITSILTHNFRYAPSFQTLMPVAASVQLKQSRNEYGPDDRSRGYYPLGKLYGMDGSENNKVVVTTGAGLRSAIAGTAPNVNVLVLQLKGILISEGATKVLAYLKKNPFI